MDDATLPVIDISPFLVSSNESLRKEQAKRIHSACKDVGFFYIIGHRLSQGEAKEIRDIAEAFFSLPQAEKDEISIANNDFARGYQRLGQNITSYAKDWHEGVDLYAPVDEMHTLRKRGLKTLTGTNPQPRNVPGFTEAVNNYVEKMKKIGVAIMSGIAMSLDLDPNFFTPFMKDSFWVMRMIGYPALSSESGNGISCGAHCDYGTLMYEHRLFDYFKYGFNNRSFASNV